MREARKIVYYCDHCTKHGMSRHAMVKHERYCTMNPRRTCRWHLLDYGPREGGGVHTMRKGLPRWIRLKKPLGEEDIVQLREYCEGCPACMLAAIRQCGIERYLLFDWNVSWDYLDEVKRYRDDEREYWQHEERRDLERSLF